MTEGAYKIRMELASYLAQLENAYGPCPLSIECFVIGRRAGAEGRL